MSRLHAPALVAVGVSISLLAALAVAGSSGATPPSTPATTETIGTGAGGSARVSSPPEESPVGIVDEEVSIDGARTHIRCIGSGDVTVVIIPGHGDPGSSWRVPAGLLSADARVCYYLHLGTGQSDPPPAVQTFTGRADRLHAVLESVGEAGPYVVVGHSLGGGEAVAFASMFADEVVGVVLVDATPVGFPEAVCAAVADCASRRDPDEDPERIDLAGSFAEIAAIDSLGAMPIVVLTAATHGRHQYGGTRCRCRERSAPGGCLAARSTGLGRTVHTQATRRCRRQRPLHPRRPARHRARPHPGFARYLDSTTGHNVTDRLIGC